MATVAAAHSATVALGDGRTPTGVLGACEEEGEGGRATGADAGQQVDGDLATWAGGRERPSWQ